MLNIDWRAWPSPGMGKTSGILLYVVIEGPDLRPGWAKLQDYFYMSWSKGLTFARDYFYIVWYYVLLLISYVGEGFEEIAFKEERFENTVWFWNVLKHKLLLQKNTFVLCFLLRLDSRTSLINDLMCLLCTIFLN